MSRITGATVVAGVAGLDVDDADPGLLGAGDDAADAAALGALDVPDPHPLAVEGRFLGRGRDRGVTGASRSTRGSASRGWRVRDERHCKEN